MPYKPVQPVVEPKVLALCQKPYQGHTKGCPNWRKREDCPPMAKLLPKTLDLDEPVYAIWNVFDLKAHVEKMQERHPEWSWRQLTNCLYWQGTARKTLRAEIEKFRQEVSGTFRVLTCPEACGLNVTATMAAVGEELEWPPRTKTYQVALAGHGRLTGPIMELFG